MHCCVKYMCNRLLWCSSSSSIYVCIHLYIYTNLLSILETKYINYNRNKVYMYAYICMHICVCKYNYN